MPEVVQMDYLFNISTEDNRKKTEEFTNNKKMTAAPDWTVTFDRVTATLTIIGFIANTLCFVNLRVVNKGFAAGILFLLRVQSIFDAGACLFAALLLLAPPLWVTGK